MASIQSLGVGSGLLTSELVDDIIATEREPTELRLNVEQEVVEAKISAYGEVVSSVSTFSSSLQSLSLPSLFNASSATSTNEDYVSATASSIATPGNYVVEVSALAQNHSVATDAYEALDDIVGNGALTFNFGTISRDGSDNYQSFTVNPDAQTKTVVIDSTNNTLTGVRDAINDADFGVQATIVDDGSGFRLLFSTDEGGGDNSMEIVASGDDGLKALNYNLASETATLSAQISAGSADLSTGAGLDSAEKVFAIEYNGVAMNIAVSSDPLIDTTAEVLAAVQAALDTELVAEGFSAGDVVASADSDRLVLSSVDTGFATTLEVTDDGSAASITAGNAISDGFDFSINNATFSIAIDGGAAQAIVLDTATASRQETVDLINQQLTTAGINTDVVASLSASDEIVFIRSNNGSAASITVSALDVSGTAATAELGLSATSASGLDGFGLDAGEGQVSGSVRLSQTVAAQDASLTVNGLSVTRNSNLVAGVVSGTTLNLKAVTVGPITLTIQKDSDVLIEKVQDFVDSYNELKNLTSNLTAFDPSVGENGQGSILLGDSTLRAVTSGINSLLRSAVTGLSGSVRSLSEIGISTNQNNSFQLTFDTAQFKKKYESAPEAIQALFSNAGSTTDSRIEYVSSASETQPGSYDLVIDTLATVGSYQTHAIPDLAAGNIVIDDDNDQFTISLNGVSANISLTQGTYATASELAQQIQQQVNSDTTYKQGNHSMSVSYNSAAKRFEMASNIYGSNSGISFTSTDSNVANTLGILKAGEGPFQTNQLAGLATATGLGSENFTTALTIDAETSFDLSIDGVKTGLLTLPGTSGAPVIYNTPDDLIAAISAQIDADGAFLAKPASTLAGEVLVAGADFSVNNRSMTFSMDGGGSEVVVTVSGDSSSVAFGGETPGTLANALAAIQDAIDSTSLSGQVVASLDANDKIIFSSVATGSVATLDVVANGTGAQFNGNSALNVAGFDFATTSANFDISVDGEAAISLSIDSLSSDRDETVQAVQDALNAAGIGSRVTASLDGSNQLQLLRSSDAGASTSITISNSDATAIAELGLSDITVNGLDGFALSTSENTGADAKPVTIEYTYDSDAELGRLVFSSDDNSDIVEFDNVSTAAANKLGVFIGDGTVTTATDGIDVAGTINGIEAIGTGQILRAASGNVPAKPGFYLNAAHGTLSSSTSNDTFTITVNGITSSAITLGTITNTDPDAVAASMQSAINGNPALLAAGVGVKVEYDSVTGGFGIISKTTGPASTVSITALSGSAGSIFGFVPGMGAKGAVGSVAQGTPDPSAGIRIEVAGGALGDRGSVSFVRGIADQLDTLVDSFLDSNGLLSNRTSALNKELEGIADDRADMEVRLKLSEDRLRASFLANDLIISGLNTTSDYLTSQLSLLEGLLGSKKDK